MRDRASEAPSICSMADERGVALLIVLWIVVLMNVIALNFIGAGRLYSASTRNLREETIAYYLALSGYNEAVNYLLSDKDHSFDFVDAEGNFWTDRDTQPVTGKRQAEGGEVDIQIIDEDSKVNINFAGPERLRSVLTYAGIKDEEMNDIIDSIMDWRDPDDEHHLSGAESDHYEGLEIPYKAKNGPFDVPDELALVKGVRPDHMSGPGGGRSLADLVTTFGTGSININTVTKETMELIGLDQFEIEAIMKQRNGEAGGFRFVPPEFGAKGLNSISSSNLRIEVTARTSPNTPAAKITAVVSRQFGEHGYKIQTLYWRERAENIGG